MTTSALAPDIGGVTRPPDAKVLAAIAVAGFGAAAASAGLALAADDLPDPLVQATLLDWITLPFILAGVVAWWRRPESRFGALMIAGGFTIFLSTLAWAQSDVAHTFGQLFDILPAAFLLHVYLAFPTGRLAGRREQVLLAAAYATAIGLQVLKMTLGYGSRNVLEIVPLPNAAQMVERVQLVAMSVFCLVGVGILVVRSRRIRSLRRPALGLLIKSFTVALVMISVLFLFGAFDLPAFETVRRVTFVVVGISPIVFLIGLLDARLARSGLGDLIIELRTDPAGAKLRDALAHALGDPSLSIAYWLPEFHSWADLEGRPVELPIHDDNRTATLIEREGQHVAVLLHNRALNEEPELLDAVTAAAGIALDNGRLQAELRARLEELQGSRARVIEIAQKERQRLERNLHDGAQQRLIALSVDLHLLKDRVKGDPTATKRLDRAEHEIAMSLKELRDVASGIHPAIVSGHGLDVALEQLAARAPVPVRLGVSVQGRLPERIEVAAFYVVSESLVNIGKHANATSATVDVGHTNGEVVIDVVDDGVGGADTERGSGLRGLADRTEALGGRLRIWSPRGGGTRLRAEIPCA
jgi:signal transduction histidine kinase